MIRRVVDACRSNTIHERNATRALLIELTILAPPIVWWLAAGMPTLAH